MFEHNPALGSTPFAERNETVGMSPTPTSLVFDPHQVRKEQYVHRELSRRLPEIFMPMLETRSRRQTVSLVPLFPQYLFARLELAAHYFEIRYMPGVVGFISTGGELLAVAQTIVDNIRSRCRDGVVQIPRRPFQHGQHVRIISGPFCEFDAIFEGYLSGSKRVAILITTVEGCGVRVVADAASIAMQWVTVVGGGC